MRGGGGGGLGEVEVGTEGVEEEKREVQELPTDLWSTGHFSIDAPAAELEDVEEEMGADEEEEEENIEVHELPADL